MIPIPSFLHREADPPAKRAIMSAALALFAEHGVDGVSIRDVADAAGYTNPALFRHFDGKDALAIALFDACYRRLGATVMAAGGSDPAEQLHETLRWYLVAIDETPDAVLFVQDNLRRYWPRLAPDPQRRSLLAHMRGLVEAGRRAGSVAADTDATLAAGAIIGMLAQTARLVQAGEIAGPASVLVDAIETLVTRMLNA